MIPEFDPALDLVLEREIDLAPELIWAAWTRPELVMQWFTPAPWKTTGFEIDLRPGGVFRTVMCSPDGQEFPNAGCYLEVVENRRLVWSCALGPGFRPLNNASAPFTFTAIITLEPRAGGTSYRVHLLHGTAEGCKQHDEMGFHAGWGAALDQLVALMSDA